jgi:hypothetical protein
LKTQREIAFSAEACVLRRETYGFERQKLWFGAAKAMLPRKSDGFARESNGLSSRWVQMYE